jgi:Universal stress protein family
MQEHNFGSRKIPSMRLPSDKERESYPIDQWFDRSSDRYGHLVTPGSRPSKIGPLQISSFAEPDELGKPGAHDSVIENTAVKSPIRRILIPIDLVQVKVADLRPILQIAQRFDAEVTLFHCFEMPPSFCYAAGRSALTDLILHRRRVRMRLLKLCTEVRRLFPKCCSEFASGSQPIEILRASRQIQSDLIVVLLSPEFVSHSWTAKELMDELVRKANCAVLGISSSRSEEPIASKSHPED